MKKSISLPKEISLEGNIASVAQSLPNRKISGGVSMMNNSGSFLASIMEQKLTLEEDAKRASLSDEESISKSSDIQSNEASELDNQRESEDEFFQFDADEDFISPGSNLETNPSKNISTTSHAKVAPKTGNER
jgi:hypothetical protein